MVWSEKLVVALVASGLILGACTRRVDPPEAPAEVAPAASSLGAVWTGPYGGVPAFDTVSLDDLQPSVEAATAAELAEIAEITANSDPPTFENTIVALERTGQQLDRVLTYYDVWSSSRSSPEFRAVEARIAPLLAAHRVAIAQDAALFARVRAVHDGPERATLRPEQQRLVDRIHDRFARRGAKLEGADKERYAAIEGRLAELYTAFGNHVLADEEGVVHFLTEDQLGGLSPSLRAAAARVATERGREGAWAIANTRSSVAPFLTASTERGLREQVWRAYYARGDNGDANDNNAVIAEILALRHERSALLGFETYAHWRLEDRMARTPERALELMEAVWPAAVARVAEEVADMQALTDAEGADFAIAPWDYRFYAEKVRKQRYDFDSDEVRAYLQLDKLREALFHVAGELFGFHFTPVPEGSVPVFHDAMRVWEVTDDDGTHVGLWYLDPYARPGKRSGAWADTYRRYRVLDGAVPSVLSSNNSNFVAGAPGEPVLISWDDTRTLFHEFGHALHGLSAKNAYPGLGGALRDVVEFQSQLLEHWVLTEPVVQGYLVHHETGEPIPAELVEKLRNASTFNQGFATTEFLASALVDMRFHTTDPTGLDPDAFERETLEALGMPEQIVMRHRSPQFGHIFSGEGYSAGYYSYLWADVLTSDAAEAFREAPGGFYDEELAGRLVEHLFEAQNSVPPEEAYRAFRGRDASLDALLRDRGFPVVPATGR